MGLETLAHNARYASRILRQRPAFTSVAFLALALALGVNGWKGQAAREGRKPTGLA